VKRPPSISPSPNLDRCCSSTRPQGGNTPQSLVVQKIKHCQHRNPRRPARRFPARPHRSQPLTPSPATDQLPCKSVPHPAIASQIHPKLDTPAYSLVTKPSLKLKQTAALQTLDDPGRMRSHGTTNDGASEQKSHRIGYFLHPQPPPQTPPKHASAAPESPFNSQFPSGRSVHPATPKQNDRYN
jgi:hypothetical protein